MIYLYFNQFSIRINFCCNTCYQSSKNIFFIRYQHVSLRSGVLSALPPTPRIGIRVYIFTIHTQTSFSSPTFPFGSLGIYWAQKTFHMLLPKIKNKGENFLSGSLNFADIPDVCLGFSWWITLKFCQH